MGGQTPVSEEEELEAEIVAAVVAAALAAIEAFVRSLSFRGALFVPNIRAALQVGTDRLADHRASEWYSSVNSDAPEWLASILQDLADQLRRDLPTSGATAPSMRATAEETKNDPRWTKRAQVWATTVAQAFLNGARQAAYAARGKRKRWITAGDTRVRDTHRRLDGQVVGAFDVFYVNGWPARYPASPTLPIEERINCRCRIVEAD